MNAYEKIQRNILLFSVPLKKEPSNGKTIRYKLKSIDSFRFMSTYYQKLLITYLKFIGKNVEIKTANLSVSLKLLKKTFL